VIITPGRARVLRWLLLGSCAATVAALLAALAPLIAGGHDRIAGAALPFAVAAAALLVLAVITTLESWISMILYVLAALATTYGAAVLASLPLRLAVLGTCPSAATACSIGYEPPMTALEKAGVNVGIALAIIGLLALLGAVEVRHRPRLRVFGPPAPLVEDGPQPTVQGDQAQSNERRSVKR
jgi:hypothetical protein